MTDRRRTFLLAPLLVLLAASGCDREADSRWRGTLADVWKLGEREDLNVLFVLVDTLRADHLGSYGYARDTSPVIDELARRGIRFAHHVSQSSWTKCSMASLWTGVYPNRSRVLHAQHAISEAAVLPAEIFRDAGFRTAGIWRNGWIAPNFGFSQGFEIYHSPSSIVPASVQREHPERTPVGDGDVIRSANLFFRTHTRERWFLYLHLMDVHQYSYDPASALFGTSYADNYDNAIRWTDSLLGHLLAELDRLDLRDRTLIVIAGDHGEAFGEHGGEGHARDVYAEVTETPFIISFPFRLEPGIVVESRSRNVDLWPTLLDLLDLPALEDPDGRSLRAEIEAASRAGDPSQASNLAFAHLDAAWARDPDTDLPIIALNAGHWRLIYDARLPEHPQLFHKLDDPGELHDVADEHPDVVEELVGEIFTYLERDSSPWGEDAPVIEIDDMQLQQLRAIGYGAQ